MIGFRRSPRGRRRTRLIGMTVALVGVGVLVGRAGPSFPGPAGPTTGDTAVGLREQEVAHGDVLEGFLAPHQAAGRRLYEEGKFEEARVAFHEVLRLDPADPWVPLYLRMMDTLESRTAKRVEVERLLRVKETEVRQRTQVEQGAAEAVAAARVVRERAAPADAHPATLATLVEPPVPPLPPFGQRPAVTGVAPGLPSPPETIPPPRAPQAPLGDAQVFKLKPEEAQARPVVVDGDEVEYFQEAKKVIGRGHVIVRYEDLELAADQITVWMETQEAEAIGHVVLTQAQHRFTGDRALYNFGTKQGRWSHGTAFAPPLYGTGDEVERVSETEYRLTTSEITTCPYPDPHYRWKSQRAIIYLEDKVVAYNNVFFVGETPVFWTPYLVRPLDEDRARIKIVPGYTSSYGYFLLTSFGFTPHPRLRGDFNLNGYTKRGIAPGLDLRYDTKYVGSGEFKSFLLRDDQAPLPTGDPDVNTREDGRHTVRLLHWWEIEKNEDAGRETLARLEWHEMSDAWVRRDFFRRMYREDTQPESQISVLRITPDYVANVVASKRTNRFFSETQSQPDITLSIPQQRLGQTPLYYRGTNRVANLRGKSANSVEHDDVVVGETRHELSFAERWWGFTVNPSAEVQEFEAVKGVSLASAYALQVFNFETNVRTRFHRVFDVATEALGLEVHRLRHVLEPFMAWEYTPNPTVNKTKPGGFTGVGRPGGEHVQTLGLEQKLQTKRRIDGKEQPVDLVDAITSVEYVYSVEIDDGSKEQELANFLTQVELRPYPWMGYITRIHVDQRATRADAVESELILTRGHRLELNLGERYIRDSGHQWIANTFWQVSPKWAVELFLQLEQRAALAQEAQLTFFRDLHDWVIEVGINYKDYEPVDPPANGNLASKPDRGVYAILRLKSFPGFEAETGGKRIYYRRRIGQTVPGSTAYPVATVSQYQ